MPIGNISAEVITCPGRLGDFEYAALQINIDGFTSPYVLTLALPAVGCHALREQIDPLDLYKSLAQAINAEHPAVDLSDAVPPAKQKVANLTR